MLCAGTRKTVRTGALGGHHLVGDPPDRGDRAVGEHRPGAGDRSAAR